MVRINAERVLVKVELKESGAQLEIPICPRILFGQRSSKTHSRPLLEFLTHGSSLKAAHGSDAVAAL